MLLSLCRCQLRHIHHASINIATSVLGGLRWQSIWRISWSRTRYWIILWLWSCVLWRAGWLLTNQGQLRWINDWIIQWRRHRYPFWWKIIALWVTALEIKAPVVPSSCSLPTLIFRCPTFWRLPIPFGRGMMNSILVCGGVVCLMICLLMANEMWEQTFGHNNCSHVWVSVPGIKLRTSFLPQYNPN